MLSINKKNAQKAYKTLILHLIIDVEWGNINGTLLLQLVILIKK